MPEFSLIVPPIIETALTGFRIGAEKRIYGALWRVEFWRGETFPRISKNGNPIAVANCPEHAARFSNLIRDNYLTSAAQ